MIMLNNDNKNTVSNSKQCKVYSHKQLFFSEGIKNSIISALLSYDDDVETIELFLSVLNIYFQTIDG